MQPLLLLASLVEYQTNTFPSSVSKLMHGLNICLWKPSRIDALNRSNFELKKNLLLKGNRLEKRVFFK